MMFGNECDTGNDERVQAAGEIHLLMQMGMTLVFPDADSEALASAAWALAHGLACLHLDGKCRRPRPVRLQIGCEQLLLRFWRYKGEIH
ncbi:hypothetical protein ACETU7_21380 [Rhodococcus sp. 3Y1]